MKTGVRVADLMTRNMVTISQDASLKRAVELMYKNEVGCLIVKENGKAIGIVTEEDIVRRGLRLKKGIGNIKMRDIMTSKVIHIEPGKDLLSAIELMKLHNIRHLPVVEENKLQGIITSRDILKINPSLFETYAEKFELKEERQKLRKGKRW